MLIVCPSSKFNACIKFKKSGQHVSLNITITYLCKKIVYSSIEIFGWYFIIREI